jgi:glutathione S-transferase
MYTLHIANKNYSSWSLRPWVLMTTLGIPFKEEIHPFDGQDNSARFRSFSPSGRVPCLVDGDLAVWDSLAIAEYLAERHAGVWPTDPKARAWARCVAAEMHSSFTALRNICGMNCGVRVELFETPASLKADIARIAELWSQGFAQFGGAFLAGPNFTAVDAFFAPVTFRALSYGLDFGLAGKAYAAMIRDLPAMRSWYEAALAETWRDASHDDEVKAAGRVVEDLRAA